ncbi:MAG: cell division protein FtsZ [Pseudomonadota bacterium]|nr:cell division protein FtsZ [Pseudomonadota bacterium]
MLVQTKIKIIGVGGGGGNTVNNMISSGLKGVDFIVADTNARGLAASLASAKVQLGSRETRGLGAGAKPEVGCRAALEGAYRISELLSGVEMVFVAAGMGGGTGTGGAPMVAKLAREAGALVVGVVTKPFNFEGRKKMEVAEAGLEKLLENVDALIVISNQRLLNFSGKYMTMKSAFMEADNVLLQAVRSISDFINVQAKLNLDFNDVKNILVNAGIVLLGTGVADGENRAVEAAEQALAAPFQEDLSIQGAQSLIINFTGPSNMSLYEMTQAADLLIAEIHEEAEIITGIMIDDSLADSMRITVVASGCGF